MMRVNHAVEGIFAVRQREEYRVMRSIAVVPEKSGRQSGFRLRLGFTLVELMVSVLVLAVGLLALTGASAVVARQVSGGAQLTLAATMAQSRFESMRGRDCATLEGGASERGGIAEQWSVVRSGPVLEVTDTVRIVGRHAHRVHAFRTSIPCRDRP